MESRMKRCPHCRSFAVGDAARCPICGNDVPKPIDPAGYTAGPVQREQSRGKAGGTPGGLTGRWGFWAGLVTYAVCLVGFPVFALNSKSNEFTFPGKLLVGVLSGVLA